MTTDVRYALRSLLRARWFTVAAVFTFALGIGVNVAVFSTVDRILLRPLPYGSVDELVMLRACGQDGECVGGFPSLVAFEGRARLSTIDGIAVAAMPSAVSITRTPGEEPPLRLSGVSANLLRVLRVQPVLGRDFSDEDHARKRRVALLSHETWERRFGGSPDVITRAIGMGATPIHIVGVLPAGFVPPTWTAPDPAWDGLILDSAGWAAIGPEGMISVPVARLAAGATLASARAEVEALVRALEPQLRGRDGNLPVFRVDPVQSALFSRFHANARLILAAAFVLLLLACANLANLLLARGRSREYDAAIHASLGAGPGRLIGSALLESLIVRAAGTAIALGVVAMTSKALATVLPPLLARYAVGATDPRVLVVTLLVALTCAIAAGVLPAWRASRADVLSVLQSASAGRQRSRLRGGQSLIVVESALAVLLVLSGLLLFRSFANFSGQDLGFSPDDLYSVTTRGPSAPGPRPTPEVALARYEQSLAGLRAVPGVASVGGADTTVVSGQAPMRGLSKDRSIRGGRYQVSAGYFETLKTRFIAGRSFTEAEVARRAQLGVLSASAAGIFFPGVQSTQVVGRSLQIDDEPARTIVGIIPNLKDGGYGDEEEAAALFLPLGTQPTYFGQMLIRMEPGAAPPRAILQQRLSDVLGQTVTVTITPIAAGLEPALRDPRFRAVLLTVLSIAALLLAAIGLYAISSFDVAQRRYEMAVRLSLGARARDIQRLVIWGACRPVILGIVLGVAGAYWAEQFLKAFLFGVAPRDPAAYSGVVLILLATTMFAAWLPARRAVRVDPATTLRTQ